MSWAGEAKVEDSGFDHPSNDNTGHLMITLSNFAVGSSSLKTEHKHFLDTGTKNGGTQKPESCVRSKWSQAASFEVMGYATPDGGADDEYNRRLAWRRAFAVCEYLNSHDGSGVPRESSKFKPDEFGMDGRLTIVNKANEQNPDDGVLLSTDNPEDDRKVSIKQTSKAWDDTVPKDA
jgi:hypothetical protein